MLFSAVQGIELVHQMAYNDDIDTIPVKEVAMKLATHNYLLADAANWALPPTAVSTPVSV